MTGNLVSVNWHVWPWCNYRCSFCFAQFKETQKSLDRDVALRVVSLLADAGVEKLTFAGGEPTLCPWLVDLLRRAKEHDMTTMIVTNGTGISASFLGATRGSLDWVAISVDSAVESTEVALGRGRGGHVDRARDAASLVKGAGVRLKLNTVVTSLNVEEDMRAFVTDLTPERWKVFQMLPVVGENDEKAQHLAVSRDAFDEFLERHRDLDPIGEDNDAMTESYLMLDPLARFFQNSGGRYTTGRSLLDVGVAEAARDVAWDRAKFVARGGVYAW